MGWPLCTTVYNLVARRVIIVWQFSMTNNKKKSGYSKDESTRGELPFEINCECDK